MTQAMAGRHSSQAATVPQPGAPQLQRRPDGMPATVPPPDVPLALLAASGLGLVAAGAGLAAEAGHAVAVPTADSVVSVVHLVMLAFLSTGVLGALHQFAPVVARRSLRSVWAARVTAVLFVFGAWALPGGFAFHSEGLLMAGGASVTAAVLLVAWNLSGPLSVSGAGTPVLGLRWSVLGLVATAGFGITYVADRQAGERWFVLVPHLVLAHAHLGLLGWLGLTYVAVAEKLWPMFLLAHRPGASPGRWAVRVVPAGLAAAVTGLVLEWKWLAAAGGVGVGMGLAFHLASFAGLLRHRRRRLELLHAFIAASACFLVAGGVLAAVAGFAPVATITRMRIVSAEIAALAGWLALALLGHAHRVVPFVTWGILRRGGVQSIDGRPLLFSDLYDHRIATATFVCAVAGAAAIVAGLAAGWSPFVAAGGLAWAAAGLLGVGNLASGPPKARRRSALSSHG